MLPIPMIIEERFVCRSTNWTTCSDVIRSARMSCRGCNPPANARLANTSVAVPVSVRVVPGLAPSTKTAMPGAIRDSMRTAPNDAAEGHQHAHQQRG